jgi:hypothetical protein
MHSIAKAWRFSLKSTVKVANIMYKKKPKTSHMKITEKPN